MKKIKWAGMLLAVIMPLALLAQESKERVQASYLLAMGRLPSPGEITYWQGQGNLSVQQMVDRHKTYIGQDAGTRRAVIIKSYVDGLGYNPSEDEIKYHNQYPRTYTEMVNAHMQYIAANRSQREAVIKRSYRGALRREASASEVTHWMNQAVISYTYLMALHEDWVRRGGNGTNSSTSVSTSSPVLAVATVSGTVLAEAKATVASLTSNSGGAMVAAGGGNMVAAGGGNMVAAGGGNMVAAGGGN